MEIRIKKVVAANKKGKFISVDSRSGGYPCVSNDIAEALMFNENDEEGRSKLEDHIFEFSDKHHGGKNNLHNIFNDFKVVIVDISFNI